MNWKDIGNMVITSLRGGMVEEDRLVLVCNENCLNLFSYFKSGFLVEF